MLDQLIAVYHWIGHNAAAVILWSIVLLCVCCVGAIVVEGFRAWRRHVEHQAERQRRRHLEVIHRTPRPMSERASQGFTRNGGGPHVA